MLNEFLDKHPGVLENVALVLSHLCGIEPDVQSDPQTVVGVADRLRICWSPSGVMRIASDTNGVAGPSLLVASLRSVVDARLAGDDRPFIAFARNTFELTARPGLPVAAVLLAPEKYFLRKVDSMVERQRIRARAQRRAILQWIKEHPNMPVFSTGRGLLRMVAKAAPPRQDFSTVAVVMPVGSGKTTFLSSLQRDEGAFSFVAEDDMSQEMHSYLQSFARAERWKEYSRYQTVILRAVLAKRRLDGDARPAVYLLHHPAHASSLGVPVVLTILPAQDEFERRLTEMDSYRAASALTNRAGVTRWLLTHPSMPVLPSTDSLKSFLSSLMQKAPT